MGSVDGRPRPSPSLHAVINMERIERSDPIRMLRVRLLELPEQEKRTVNKQHS